MKTGMKLATLKGFYDESITITISSSPCTIGRSRTADFIIAHLNVSRNHCEITKENSSWKISDYSSSGTYINDSLVGKGKSVALNNGDVIRFGPVESKLCWSFHLNEDKTDSTVEDNKLSLNTKESKSNEELQQSKQVDNCTKDKKSDILENITDVMETELQCTICSEMFLTAVTLSCTHTFCKYCIDQWKKKQKTCPICRKKITNETRSLVVDNYIDKMIENLSCELKERREAIIKERNTTEPSRKRSRLRSKNH